MAKNKTKTEEPVVRNGLDITKIEEPVKPVESKYPTVAEINEELLDAPEKINEDPYGAWLVKVENITDTVDLLDCAAYEQLLEEEA